MTVRGRLVVNDEGRLVMVDETISHNDAKNPGPSDIQPVTVEDIDIDGYVSGDITNGIEITDLLGSNLSVSNGTLNASTGGSGVTYVQSSKPGSASSGETLIDTGTGIFYVYFDLGSGKDWHSIQPVQVTEEASTFTETDISITHTDTVVSSGSIELQSTSTTTVVLPNDTNTDTNTLKRGVIVNPNATLSKLEGVISSNTSNFTKAYIEKHSNGSLIADKNVSSLSSNDTVSFTGLSLSSGTEYRFVMDNQGSNWSQGRSGASYPYTSTNVDVTAESKGGSKNTARPVWATVSGTASNNITSGDALVSWNTGVPTDIGSWDLATYQETPDGETVTIDIEDSNGNVLFSDIGKNKDISSVSTSKDVQMRANLSRNNTSNNPTCDYLARRFVR